MKLYVLEFFGGNEPLPPPIRFKQTDDQGAIHQADDTWQKGTYTTTAKGYTLREEGYDTPFHMREIRKDDKRY